MKDYNYHDVVWWSPTLVSDAVLWTSLFALVLLALAMYFGRNS